MADPKRAAPVLIVLLCSLGWCMATCFSAEVKPALLVRVTARDARTHEPIERLRIVPTSRYGNESHFTWQSRYLKEFTQSPAEFRMEKGWEKTLLRIEADGYLPQVTRVIRRGEGELEFDLSLESDPGLVGKVLKPDGAPADGVTVAVCTWTNEVTVSGGELRYGHHAQQLRPLARTARDGSFRVPSEIDQWLLVFAHESGYAEATAAEFGTSSTVSLRPWGRVEGDFVLDGKPAANTVISVGSGRGDLEVILHYSAEAVTGPDGKFAVETVPPTQQFIQPRFKFGENTYSPSWFGGLVEIMPGETTRISLPRGGQPVVGRIAMPADSELAAADLSLDVSIFLRPPSVSGPQDLVQRAFKAYGEFMNSEYAPAYRRDKIAVAADGAFRIEGLPETAYVLRIEAFPKTDPPATDPQKSVASHSRRVDVPPLDEKGTSVDLGQMVLKLHERHD